MRKVLRGILRDYLYLKIAKLVIMASILTLCLEGIAITKRQFLITESIIGFYFLLELILKIFSFGPKIILNDKLNLLEIFICTHFVVKFTLLVGDQLETIENDFRSWRMFQILMVFRIFRVLRSIHYMQFIYEVIKMTFKSFITLALVMLLFISSFCLIALNLFKKEKDLRTLDTMKKPFSSFNNAFTTIFTLITLDDWYKVLVNPNTEAHYSFVLIFLFLVVIIGNFILLNLFIANMLIGFENTEYINDSKAEDAVEDNKKNEYQDLEYIEKLESEFTNIAMSKRGSLIRAVTKSEFLNYGYKLISLSAQKLKLQCQRLLNLRVFWLLNVLTIFIAFLTVYMETMEELKEKYLIEVLNFIVFSWLVFDSILRIFAFGLLNDKNSYFKHPKNIFNAICVGFLILDLFLNFKHPQNERIEFMSFFRSFQLLRIVFEFNHLYVVTKAMIQSFNGIFNVILVVFCVWFNFHLFRIFFGIIGFNIFRDRFGYCIHPVNLLVNKNSCPEGEWENYLNNFDTIGHSFLTLLVVSTYDRWSDILAIAVNSDVSERGPKLENNKWSSYIFFISFTIIGSWFFSNLFIGVIFKNFFTAEKKARHPHLTENQTKWLELIKLIKGADPIKFRPPEKGIKRLIYEFFQSKKFNFFISLIICWHSLVLSLYAEKMSTNYENYYIYLSYSFFIVYILECTLKIFCWGIKGYFFQKKHLMEIIIVFFGVLELILNPLIEDLVWKRLIALFRLLPFLRIFILIKSLNTFLNTLLFTIPNILYMMCFMLIISFVYSVLGWYLFKEIEEGVIINDLANFWNIQNSLLILFQVSTAEDWSLIMWDCYKPKTCKYSKNCGSLVAIPYFVFFLIISYFIMINMFVLVLLKNFEEYSNCKLNPTVFMNGIVNFRRAWAKFVMSPGHKAMKTVSMINPKERTSYSKEVENVPIEKITSLAADSDIKSIEEDQSSNQENSRSQNNSISINGGDEKKCISPINSMYKSKSMYTLEIIDDSNAFFRRSSNNVGSNSNLDQERNENISSKNNSLIIESIGNELDAEISKDLEEEKFSASNSRVEYPLKTEDFYFASEKRYSDNKSSEKHEAESKKIINSEELGRKSSIKTSQIQNSQNSKFKSSSLSRGIDSSSFMIDSSNNDNFSNQPLQKPLVKKLMKSRSISNKKVAPISFLKSIRSKTKNAIQKSIKNLPTDTLIKTFQTSGNVIKNMASQIGNIIGSSQINVHYIHITRIPRFLKVLGSPLGLKPNASFHEMGKMLLTMSLATDYLGNTTFHHLLYATLKYYFSSILEKNSTSKGKKLFRKFEKVFIDSMKESRLKSIIGNFGTFRENQKLVKTMNPLPIYLDNIMIFRAWKNYVSKVMNSGKKQENFSDDSRDDENEPKKMNLLQRGSFDVIYEEDEEERKASSISIIYD